MEMPGRIEDLEVLLRELVPGAKVRYVRPLQGGISAQTELIDVQTENGFESRLVLRRLGKWILEEQPDAAENEARLLRHLRSVGLKVPHVYGSLGGVGPNLVLEYIDGAPELRPSDPHKYLRHSAEAMAQIHEVPVNAELSFLPRQRLEVSKRAEPNEALGETQVTEALLNYRGQIAANRSVLRHGDFWPGNLVWRDGDLVGIIDWEEALIGEPLADLGIARLDVWWVLGETAALEFTERYLAMRPLDTSCLPYWDLWASRRPMPNIEEWAPAYAEIGRPDITPESMIHDLLAFVDQALTKL